MLLREFETVCGAYEMFFINRYLPNGQIRLMSTRIKNGKCTLFKKPLGEPMAAVNGYLDPLVCYVKDCYGFTQVLLNSIPLYLVVEICKVHKISTLKIDPERVPLFDLVYLNSIILESRIGSEFQTGLSQRKKLLEYLKKKFPERYYSFSELPIDSNEGDLPYIVDAANGWNPTGTRAFLLTFDSLFFHTCPDVSQGLHIRGLTRPGSTPGSVILDICDLEMKRAKPMVVTHRIPISLVKRVGMMMLQVRKMCAQNNTGHYISLKKCLQICIHVDILSSPPPFSMAGVTDVYFQALSNPFLSSVINLYLHTAFGGVYQVVLV